MNSRKMNEEETKIFEHLKGVIDPELMVNIVDLGLVYDVRLNNTEKKIEVNLTLTSPGCPMGDMIVEDARQLIASNYLEYNVSIKLVWEPAWTLANITVAGNEALNKR